MTSLPYPAFLTEKPVDTTQNRLGLSAVGRCRVYPREIVGAEYSTIVAKNAEQAHVDTNVEDKEKKDELKKLKKKYMKEGNAMGKTFLTDTLELDVSVIDVEVVVNPNDLISTDGCLAACLLDSGCHAVVTDGTDLEAMDAAKIPKGRLVAHFKYDKDLTKLGEAFTAAAALASSVSVEMNDDITLETILDIFKCASSQKIECVVQVNPSSMEEDALEMLMKGIHEGAPEGRIALVDPSPRQLGLCYAACIRTDREDKLYTTVVCTRNGEALGLVYSSKVCPCHFLKFCCIVLQLQHESYLSSLFNHIYYNNKLL